MLDATLRRRIALGASALTGAAGAVYGFAFGVQLDSIALALLTGANGAVLGAFAVGALVEQGLSWAGGKPSRSSS